MAIPNRPSLYIGVKTVMEDVGCSKAKAYQIIRELNAELKEKKPMSIILSGKVNRVWYEEALDPHCR